MNQGKLEDWLSEIRRVVDETPEATCNVVFRCLLCTRVCTASDRSQAHPGLFLCHNCRERLNPQPKTL